MRINKLYVFSLISLLSLGITSCDQGPSETAIAKAISLKVSSSPVVLPTTLDDDPLDPETCIEGGVSGPRVRFRASIAWAGTGQGTTENLVPLTMTLSITRSAVLGGTEFTQTIGASDSSESISSIFGAGQDYIPPDGQVLSSNVCFFDYGGLPEPKNKLTGANQLYVNVTLRLMGVVRNGESEKPFMKEVNSRVLYVAGSIPTE